MCTFVCWRGTFGGTG